MGRAREVARMAMGGAVWGGFLGLPLGAALGLLLGLLYGNVSWGLDGAVLGILGLSVAGAVLGAWVGVADHRRSLPSPDEGRTVKPRR
ncbi:MAG TPA: hypothetical protein VKA46_26230 [Gemmataceae bacterium]|nr:hypothetical protein [Gemmataceae bacterium]